jgi:predicted nucleic acid-binding protein
LAGEKVRAYVLDASIAVKWFVDEQGSEKARALRDWYVEGRLDLAAPDLLKYEVANALLSHPVADFDRWSLAKALDALDDYQFLSSPSREAWNIAVELTYASGISVYDGIYIGLSQALKCPLITADEKLIKALSPERRMNALSLSRLELSN